MEWINWRHQASSEDYLSASSNANVWAIREQIWEQWRSQCSKRDAPGVSFLHGDESVRVRRTIMAAQERPLQSPIINCDRRRIANVCGIVAGLHAIIISRLIDVRSNRAEWASSERPWCSRKGRKDRPFARSLASCLLGKRARNCRLCLWRTMYYNYYTRNVPRSCAWGLAANSNYMRLTLACSGIIITRLLPHSALIKYLWLKSWSRRSGPLVLVAHLQMRRLRRHSSNDAGDSFDYIPFGRRFN